MRLIHMQIVGVGFNKTVEGYFNFQYGKTVLVYTSFESLYVWDICSIQTDCKRLLSEVV